jgi:hypothetical protein
MEHERSAQSPTGRKVRFDKGQRQLIRRDLDILRRIGEQYTYRFDQLQAELARHPDSHAENPRKLSETRTRAAIAKWEQLGLVQSRKILHHEPAYVWLSRKGLHHAGLDVAYWEPEHSDLDHYAWINEVRVACEVRFSKKRIYQEYEWESERLWRAKRDQLLKEKKANESFLIPWPYRGRHRPDAVVHYIAVADGLSHAIAIEVQLSVKTYDWYTHVWDDLVRHFIATWYYVTPEVKPGLLAALEKWQEAKPGSQEAASELRDRIQVYDLRKQL